MATLEVRAPHWSTFTAGRHGQHHLVIQIRLLEARQVARMSTAWTVMAAWVWDGASGCWRGRRTGRS